jgi:predicted ribosomally synthesized peptide with SipW-like signal peptide
MGTSKTGGSKTRKIALSVAAAAFAAALIGVGAYAEWTSSATNNQTVSSGEVKLEFPPSGGANTFTTAATNIAPGDTVSRIVDLKNTGTIGLRQVTLASSATAGTVFSDTTNGLQLQVQLCPDVAGWSGSGTGPYTCVGSPVTVYTGPASISSPSNIFSNLTVGTVGNKDSLRFQLTLPTTAPDTMKNQSVTITYTVEGLQRTGTAK